MIEAIIYGVAVMVAALFISAGAIGCVRIIGKAFGRNPDWD